MSLLSWNCLGLGNFRRVRDLCQLVKEKSPSLVFLMETKLRSDRIENLKSKLGFDCVFAVDCYGKSGGLALFWKSDFNVIIQNFSRWHINIVVYSGKIHFHWKFSGFYGNLDAGRHKESWALLNHLATFSPQACLCTRDFNEVLVANEKRGGVCRPGAHMEAFRNSLSHCNLCDMGYSGPRYTWSNKRHDSNFITERLDRTLANTEFVAWFPQLRVDVLAARSSDHTPLLVTLCCSNAQTRRRNRTFVYEASWQKNQGFKEVKKVWRVKGAVR